MPINVFPFSSNKSENEAGARLFVQKPNLRINYIEDFKEEEIDKKSHYIIKSLQCPIE